MEYWLHETLFSFSWWLLLIVTVALFVTWLNIVDKKRIFELLTYGFLIEIIAVLSDATGSVLMLWQYKHTLTPFLTILEVHVLQMPLIYMMIYQYFKTWKSFLIASTINAFVFAFILEPTLVWLDIYKLYYWKHVYSFLPYILIAVLGKWIITQLKKKKNNG